MNSLIAALGFFVVSVLYALSGHLLWRFYAFLWRSLIGLLGFSKKQIEPEPATVPAGAAAAAEATVARVLQQHGQALLGLLGCVLAAWAFFWLLGDLVADQFTQRAIQLAALLLLTAALLFWGFRVRSAAPDTLGTGLLLLGFLQIPVDAWFYERYILGYTTRSAYQVALLLAALATFLAVRLGSRVFSWLAPQCLLAGILLVGYKLHWPASAVSYTAALSGPLLLAVALWLESVPRAKLLLMPMRVAAVAAAVAAEASFLGSSPEAVPWLPLAVALLGGGTIATVAYLASDLRGLLLLLPYFGFAFVEYFERYSTSYGPVGTVAAIAGLALLALERTRRQGAERRRGLDPWCAVPALFCLLLALSVDGLSVALSVSRVANLTPPGQIAVTGFEDAASLWADAERAIFYLARLDGTLAWASASGPLVACGLIYLGGAAAVPLFAYGGGLPLAIGALATLMRALPFELHGQSYAFCLLVMALLGASAGIVLKQPRTLAAARACGLFAHLLLPLAWFALGYRLYQPNTTPEWFLALVFAVIGAQAMFHGRIAASYPFLARLGCGMLAASWPLAIGMMPSWAARSGLVPLVACGLLVNGAIVGWAMARQEVVHALLGAAGLVLTVIVTLTTVLHGEIGAKLAILVFGLLLLYAGTRGRRRAVVGLAALWLALPAAAAPPAVPQRVTTRETLQALARANGEDPLIAVVLRATDVPVPGSETTDRLSSKLREGLSALSGIDSVQAALALASSPLRIRGSAESVASIEIDRVRAVQPRSLPYANLAKRLPGRPQLPDTAGDELDRGPADWVHLRFESAAALGRILDLYEQRGRAILAVTAPGLALPSPEAKFREMAGVELRKAIEGCTGGVLLIGDPYLGMAPELVLAARFADEAAAEARVAAWKAGAAGRTGRTGTVAFLGTTSGGTEYVLEVFQGRGRQLGSEPDFRYASLLGLKGPDGRLFVSEEAVKRLVSPGFWIASHRREDCLAELADLEAADAFGRLTQRPLPAEPEGARKKALELGWIEPRGQCRAAGSTVSRSEGGMLECSSHGSRLRPRPLRETPSFWVTAEESEAYS
ncbi:MAG: hypothetical protein HYY25_12370, partial [Candidatus Wallbacteria bacterium]|nr:hypothetical protein [Candidatus Wallbacteria bacterium]